MSDFEKAIGQRIRTLREESGDSREILSEQANISPKFLYEIECGKKGMSAATLYAVSRALNVSADYLLSGKTPNTGKNRIMAILDSLDEKKLRNLENIICSILKMCD